MPPMASKPCKIAKNPIKSEFNAPKAWQNRELEKISIWRHPNHGKIGELEKISIIQTMVK